MEAWLHLLIERPPQLTEKQHLHFEIFMRTAMQWWRNTLGEEGFAQFIGGLQQGGRFNRLMDDPRVRQQERLVELSETEMMKTMRPSGLRGLELAKLVANGEWDVVDPAFSEVHLVSQTLNQVARMSAEQLAEADPKLMLKALCDQFGTGPPRMRLPEWMWMLDDVDPVAALRSYDLEMDLYEDTELQFGIGYVYALRGDLAAAHAAMDCVLGLCRRMAAQFSGQMCVMRSRLVMVMAHAIHLPWLLSMLGREQDAREMFSALSLTWTSADESVDEVYKFSHGVVFRKQVRRRGSAKPTDATNTHSAEDLSWCIRLQCALCAAEESEVPTADIVSSVPSADVLESYIRDVGMTPGKTLHCRQGFCNLLLLAAQVFEKIDQHEDALNYLEKALQVDPSDPFTDRRPTTHAQGNALRGRILVALGKRQEAEAAFEMAVEVAHQTGLRLYELLALRDLKTLILDTDGRGEDGTRRIKAVLQEMKGPPAELTKLLGHGLDAEEILRA